MGRVRIAASPARTRNSEITAAKIGRSMKKRENMAASAGYDFGAGGALLSFAGAPPPPSGAAGPCGGASATMGAPGAQARDAVDDYALAGLEPRLDDPQVADLRVGRVDPLAEGDRAHRGHVLAVLVAVDDVDELALRAVEHRDLRNGDRLVARRAG